MELPALLTFSTLGTVAIFAYVNARVTSKQLKDRNFKRSTLCSTSEHWSRTDGQAAG
ncbi:MAG: hypothetical protein AAF755_13920 [Pseudomonadota bacterium]